MRSLITGGAGFIGSHLTEHLLGLGQEVVILDDLSTGSEHNLAAVADHPGLSVHHGSVNDPEAVEAALQGIDAIYHLAAAVGVFTILDKTLHSLRTNLLGVETVLEAARRHQVPVLLASTSEIYGKNTTEGIKEDDDRIVGSPLLNRWSYAEAKALDETYAHLYGVEYGVRSVIARLFNTVGPRQSGRYGMVVPRFVEQALAGEPLTVFGSGEQIRCFCHVLDVVPALVALMADESAYGTAYNIGSNEQISITELAERVIKATGSTSSVVHVPYQEAYGPGFEDMERRVPDCGKAERTVGFRPRRTLDDIINDVAAERRLRGDRASAEV